MIDLNLRPTNDRQATILVIDDQPINIHAARQCLAAEYEILMASNGPSGIEACRARQPDLVLLDLVMPGMSGLEVAARLRSDPLTKQIPIIFVTASSDIDEESACWEAGAVDFVTKPFNPMTLRRRAQVHLALKRQAEMLREMAYVDGLTEIPNRRYFNERFAEEVARARRESAPLAVMLADVDFFKRYNDHYGHQAGDECLRLVAGAFGRAMRRPSDFAARYGGEEFVALAPGCRPEAALQLGEALNDEVRKIGQPHCASDAAAIVTISVGVVCVERWGNQTVDSLLREADDLLYQAKQQGRDRCCVGLPKEDQ